MPTTRQLKIGLSNADKTTMKNQIHAQTIGELIDAYSSSSTYAVGDYVNKDAVIYKCTTAITTPEAWNSAHWSIATLNDVIDAVNQAVASVNDKANVDGNYPTMTVGLADNLTPYSEDSGAEQSNPFISNGTGTNNNTEIVTVGNYGLLRSKNGHTLVANQYGRPLNNTYWGISGGNVSYSDGVATITPTGTMLYDCNINLVANHKYLLFADIQLSNGTAEVGLALRDISGNLSYTVAHSVNTTNKQTLIGIASVTVTSTNARIRILDVRQSDWGTITIYKIKAIDLTQMFNGDIPQDLLDNPSHFSWYYDGDLSYNDGTLVNANGNKLVSTGRNLWDEEWELGSISSTTGQNENQYTDRIRSKNYIPVVPGAKCFVNFSKWNYIQCYDVNKNFIGNAIYESATGGWVLTLPNNARYLRFSTTIAYGNTYNHDITISLYYTEQQGGEGYDQYYPFETPYEVDTGSEVLRKAKSVKDYKTPDGVVHRIVGSYTFTGNETVKSFSTNQESTYGYHYGISIILPQSVRNIIKWQSQNANIIFSKKFIYKYANENMCFYLGTQVAGNVNFINDSATTQEQALQQIAGITIYFELAEETTEQGTPFAENLPINDYGMLYWDSDIPQGNTIFFPINYKGFVDDMYSRVDGDSTQYVIQEELQASETQRDTVDSQLLNAIGGTLRQCLCVKESLDFNNTDVVDLSTLSWSTSGLPSYAYTETLVGRVKPSGKILCSNLKVVQYDSVNGNLGTIGINSNGYIKICVSSIDDIKGVLLAYEKASS